MKIGKMALFGFFIWLICFIFGFLLFPLNSGANLPLFKSLMTVISVIVGLFFIYLYFKKIDSKFVTEGLIAGVVWFLINIILDIIFLVIMFKNPFVPYLLDIGIRYLMIIIMPTFIGFILSSKIEKDKKTE